MNTNYRIDELILLKYSAAGRFPELTTKGTKTQFVNFVHLVVEGGPSIFVSICVHSWFVSIDDRTFVLEWDVLQGGGTANLSPLSTLHSPLPPRNTSPIDRPA